jgi:hypothetical protein
MRIRHLVNLSHDRFARMKINPCPGFITICHASKTLALNLHGHSRIRPGSLIVQRIVRHNLFANYQTHVHGMQFRRDIAGKKSQVLAVFPIAENGRPYRRLQIPARGIGTDKIFNIFHLTRLCKE